MLGCPLLLDQMQSTAVLFFHFFCRNNFATKVRESNKLMLNGLQPLASLSMSDLSVCPIPAITPKLLI